MQMFHSGMAVTLFYYSLASFLRSLILKASCCTAGRMPQKGDSHSQQKSRTSLTYASTAGLQWVRFLAKPATQDIRMITLFSSRIIVLRKEVTL